MPKCYNRGRSTGSDPNGSSGGNAVNGCCAPSCCESGDECGMNVIKCWENPCSPCRPMPPAWGGATGPTGPTGATGPTGPTEPFIYAQH